MSNLFTTRLTSEDDEFMLKVDNDIRDYYTNCTENSVLIFPPVNNYYRFLIHKICETINSLELATFSIGFEDLRRTVVCRKNQLKIELKNPTSTTKSSKEYSWRYLKRNSVPKYDDDEKYQVNHRSNKNNMGIENADATTSHRPTDEKHNYYNLNSNSLLDDPPNSKKNLRTRRPERAFYVPRAKRSQTTPPYNSSNISSSQSKSHAKKSEKSKSIDECTSSSSNSEEANESLSSINQFLDGAVINNNSLEIETIHPQSSACCDNNYSEEDFETDQKNQKNLNNFCKMSQTDKDLIIDDKASNCVGGDIKSDKIDKDEKELIKASQEINRSNRKLIKQTFNSNVLEIESASGGGGGGGGDCKTDDKAVNKDDDDWDTLFDDNGDCLDPKMVDELTKAVGKVSIEKPKSDYKAYQLNVDLLRDEEYPHVLECSNFPVEFRTQDLMALFAPYAKESSNGLNVIWVDDTHALVVFSSSKIAAEVLTSSHPIVKVKPLGEATYESRTKARKCSSSLQPYRQRPETCAALAKRLVSGALGVRIKATSEERENERRLLREARERKLQAAREKTEREEMWNN